MVIDSRLIVVNNDNPGTYTGEIVYNVKSGDMLIWDNDKWIPFDSRSIIKKNEIMKDLESDPELMDEVIVELRKRKIERLKK